MTDRARWTVQYYQRVLASDPIAYWLLDEKGGTVAYDAVTMRAVGAQNGVHTAVTLGQPGIGDGRTSPLYDGVNGYTDVVSAALAAAFDGSEGTAMCWARVANAGVWTDGASRTALTVFVDADNLLLLQRNGVNNQLFWYYEANTVIDSVVLGGLTTTDWMHLALTWSASADEVRAYYNGAQTGATQVGLGAWAGVPSRTIAGASTVAPVAPWSGYLDHVALWDRPLTPAEIADLAVVE
jgi:hypothetical protein